MIAISKEIGLAQTLSISRIITKLQEIHKSESKPVLESSTKPELEAELSIAEESMIEAPNSENSSTENLENA